MARLIGPDDVREIKDKILEDVDLYGGDNLICTYVSGLVDFQNAIIRWIKEMDE